MTFKKMRVRGKMHTLEMTLKMNRKLNIIAIKIGDYSLIRSSSLQLKFLFFYFGEGGRKEEKNIDVREKY